MEQKLIEEFPQALKVELVAKKASEHLSQLGYTSDNTVFGTSMCRDVINSGITRVFSQSWGECFSLAGLAGYPSIGKTGMTAFTSQIADNGQYFILYGSHIGLSESGELGVFIRGSKSNKTKACRSLYEALSRLKVEGAGTDSIDPFDAEQDLVVNSLRKKISPDEQGSIKIKELTLIMSEIIGNTLNQMRQQMSDHHRFALLGGVIINTPKEYPDYFLPLHFTAESLAGEEINSENLLNKLLDR